jgi:hypothetical protein
MSAAAHRSAGPSRDLRLPLHRLSQAVQLRVLLQLVRGSLSPQSKLTQPPSTVKDELLKHLRGESGLSSWGQSETVAKSNTKMCASVHCVWGTRLSVDGRTNFFCKTCGTLMYRRGDGFPNLSILRIGTVDDFNLMETKLRPQREFFTKDRAAWLKPIEGVEQFRSMPK